MNPFKTCQLLFAQLTKKRLGVEGENVSDSLGEILRDSGSHLSKLLLPNLIRQKKTFTDEGDRLMLGAGIGLIGDHHIQSYRKEK